MPHFFDLSVELQELIIGKTCEGDGPLLTLKNAALVCRAWHRLAAPVLFRRFELETPYDLDPREMAPVEFLLANKQARSHIRELHIINYDNYPIPVDWCTEFEKLLPQLPRLEHVNIQIDAASFIPIWCAIDEDTDFDSHSMEDFKPILFQALFSLGRDIRITLNWLVQTLDYDNSYLSLLFNQKPTTTGSKVKATSLRIALLNRPADGEWCLYYPRPHPASASTEVGQLLKHHPSLKDLYIEIPGPSDDDEYHPDHEREKHYAMENINPNLPILKKFGLSGEFLFSEKAWSHWAFMHWHQLESLSFGHPTLINQVEVRLRGVQLPCLRSIELYALDGTANGGQGLSALPDFVTSPGVIQLCLTGYLPVALERYLHYQTENVKRLKVLCFYGPSTRAQLSATLIKSLDMCQHLAWLGLTIDEEALRAVLVSPHHSDHLNAISAIPALQHINIFIPTEKRTDDLFRDIEGIRIFRHLQETKKGCPLLSVDISWGHSSCQNSWTLWAWGKNRVLIDGRMGRRERSLEIWDLEGINKVEVCKIRWPKKEHPWPVDRRPWSYRSRHFDLCP